MLRIRRARDASAIDLAYVAGWFRRYALALWFAAVTIAIATTKTPDEVLFDGRLYVAATQVWLAGGDPWHVTMHGTGFAAPPPTLLAMVPFALLPGGLYLLAASCFLAAFLTVRALGLPLWWLLFPPLVDGLWTANVHVWLIPLLLSRAAPVAVFAKAYALVPLILLGRWRAVAVTGALLIVTAPFLPWERFLADAPLVASYFASQSGYAIPSIILVALSPLALVALWLVGQRRAAWLVVPAFFGYQWYYASFVMGTRSRLAAAIAAVPFAGWGMLALLGLGLHQAISRARSGDERSRGGTPDPSSVEVRSTE